MFSFNILTLKSINGLDDAKRKKLAVSWARKCLQGSFDVDDVLGDVFVKYSMFERLRTSYKRSRQLE